MPTYSLSYFKKRTAAINKELGTSYSPTYLWKTQARSDTARLIASVADPRAKGVRPTADPFKITAQQAAGRLMADKWANLATANNYTAVVANMAGLPDVYITGGTGKGARIYQVIAGEIVEINPFTRSMRTLTSTEIPGGARKLTLAEGNRLLQSHAKNLKKYREKSPLGNYNNE